MSLNGPLTYRGLTPCIKPLARRREQPESAPALSERRQEHPRRVAETVTTPRWGVGAGGALECLRVCRHGKVEGKREQGTAMPARRGSAVRSLGRPARVAKVARRKGCQWHAFRRVNAVGYADHAGLRSRLACQRPLCSSPFLSDFRSVLRKSRFLLIYQHFRLIVESEN